MRRLIAVLALVMALFAGSFGALAPQNSNSNSNTNSGPTDTGNPTVKVWVNKTSKVYHCPTSRYYGKTKSGEYMTQKEAQDAGNHPAGQIVNGRADPRAASARRGLFGKAAIVRHERGDREKDDDRHRQPRALREGGKRLTQCPVSGPARVISLRAATRTTITWRC